MYTYFLLGGRRGFCSLFAFASSGGQFQTRLMASIATHCGIECTYIIITGIYMYMYRSLTLKNAHMYICAS